MMDVFRDSKSISDNISVSSEFYDKKYITFPLSYRVNNGISWVFFFPWKQLKHGMHCVSSFFTCTESQTHGDWCRHHVSNFSSVSGCFIGSGHNVFTKSKKNNSQKTNQTNNFNILDESWSFFRSYFPVSQSASINQKLNKLWHCQK